MLTVQMFNLSHNISLKLRSMPLELHGFPFLSMHDVVLFLKIWCSTWQPLRLHTEMKENMLHAEMKENFSHCKVRIYSQNNFIPWCFTYLQIKTESIQFSVFLVQFSSQGSQSLVLHIFLRAWKSNIPTYRQLALCTCMYQSMVWTRGDVWYSQTPTNSQLSTMATSSIATFFCPMFSPHIHSTIVHSTIATATKTSPNYLNNLLTMNSGWKDWWTTGEYKTSNFIGKSNVILIHATGHLSLFLFGSCSTECQIIICLDCVMYLQAAMRSNLFRA